MVLHQSFPSARLVEAGTPEVGVTALEAAVVGIEVVGEEIAGEIAEDLEVEDAEVTSEAVEVVDEAVVECHLEKQDRESSRMSLLLSVCASNI